MLKVGLSRHTFNVFYVPRNLGFSAKFSSTLSGSKYVKYFEILGLPDNSSKQQVRDKYIELVKLHHPDKTRDASER